ncbi:TPR-likeprotein [Moniliophthora roreri]|nr:TPR-likeprotein [Moniliophthora roreri]
MAFLLATQKHVVMAGHEIAPGFYEERLSMPWTLAWVFTPQIEAEGDIESSASLFAIYVTSLKSRGPMFKLRLQTIKKISNGLLCDSRIFQMADHPTQLGLASKLKKQRVQSGASFHRAWVDSWPEKAFTEMERWLTGGGWDTVRPALSIRYVIGSYTGPWKDNISKILLLRSIISTKPLQQSNGEGLGGRTCP